MEQTGQEPVVALGGAKAWGRAGMACVLTALLFMVGLGMLLLGLLFPAREPGGVRLTDAAGCAFLLLSVGACFGIRANLRSSLRVYPDRIEGTAVRGFGNVGFVLPLQEITGLDVVRDGDAVEIRAGRRVYLCHARGRALALQRTVRQLREAQAAGGMV